MDKRELFVFPTRNKQPLTKNGFRDARPESQWSGKESNQWGLPCGPINGVFVVDVDAKPDDKDEKQRSGVQYHAEIQTDWGDTLIVPTPSGGYHVFYIYDHSLDGFNNAVRIVAGTDFRTQGGYVILYAELDLSKIKPMPSHIKRLFTAAAEDRRKNLRTTDDTGSVEGSRNAFLTRQAGKMQRLNVLTLAALNEVNETKCTPPLDSEEVEAIYTSVAKYAPEAEYETEAELQTVETEANDLVQNMLDHLENDAAVHGESTGIERLDDLLGGGKRLGELSVMLAEAKSGKNTFWHYQMVKMLDRGLALAYASRELDPATEVMPNLITLAMQQNVYKTKLQLKEIKERIKTWKLVFSAGIGQYNDVSELFTWLEEKISEGIKYLWIDHLHFCLPDSEDFRAVSNFIRALRTMARKHMVHIDLIIQPKSGTTQHDKNGKIIDNDLDIGSLRGGASLGQGLDNLITMQRIRDEEGNKTDDSKISLKTSRNKLAKLGSFYVHYDREKMTFSSVQKPSKEVEEDDSNRYSRRAKRNKRANRNAITKDTPIFDLSQNGYNLRKGL